MRKTIILIIITAVISSCKSNLPESKIEKAEEFIVQEKYREAIKEYESFLYEGKQNKSKPSKNDTRILAADYLCYCLLKTGVLNKKYYAYRARTIDNKINTGEMFYPVPLFTETRAGLCFAFECGKDIQTHEIETVLNADYNSRKSSVFWNILEKNSIIAKRKRYYNLLKNNIVPQLPYITDIDSNKIIREWKHKTKSTPPEAKTEMTGVFWTDIFNLFQTNYNNKDLLETYTAITLFSKQLDSLPQIAGRYNLLGYTRLPDYVQEAVMIFFETTEIYNYYGFEIEDRIRKQHIDFWRALNNMSIGIETPQTIREKFGGMYCYYYYDDED